MVLIFCVLLALIFSMFIYNTKEREKMFIIPGVFSQTAPLPFICYWDKLIKGHFYSFGFGII